MGVWEYGCVGGLFSLPYSHTPIQYKRNNYFSVTALNTQTRQIKLGHLCLYCKKLGIRKWEFVAEASLTISY